MNFNEKLEMIFSLSALSPFHVKIISNERLLITSHNRGKEREKMTHINHRTFIIIYVHLGNCISWKLLAKQAKNNPNLQMVVAFMKTWLIIQLNVLMRCIINRWNQLWWKSCLWGNDDTFRRLFVERITYSFIIQTNVVEISRVNEYWIHCIGSWACKVVIQCWGAWEKCARVVCNER